MRTIYYLFFALFLIVSLTSFKPKKKSILGTWKRVTMVINHKDVTSNNVIGFRTFYDDNTFDMVNSTQLNESVTIGNYFMPNDTTMITFIESTNGYSKNIANTYKYELQNDSLHFVGYFLSKSRTNPNVYLRVHFDEWWVRSDKHKKKKKIFTREI